MRPKTFVHKARVPLEDKPLCTEKRGRAHRWIEVKNGKPRAEDGHMPWRCTYCHKRKYHPRTLSDYERFETVVMKDPRPQPSIGLYTMTGSWGER